MSINKKTFIKMGITGASILGGLFFLNKRNSNQSIQDIPPFFNGKAPYVFAHRGGMAVRPEQTQLAFDNAVNYGLDGFETDVRLTKDEQLIVFHDATVDRTTNGSGKVSDHMLNELKQLDAGYYFKDVNGHTPYRGNEKAKILSFDELLELYPNHYINVDLKDDPDSYEGTVAPQKMFDSIKKYDAQDRVLVTSFHSEQIERFNSISSGTVAIGASQNEVAEAFVKFFSGLKSTYTPRANTFQMPLKFSGIPLTSTRFIQWLNSLNIVPGFYGVNSVDLMVDLYQKGVHTFVTDRPDIGQQFKSTFN